MSGKANGNKVTESTLINVHQRTGNLREHMTHDMVTKEILLTKGHSGGISVLIGCILCLFPDLHSPTVERPCMISYHKGTKHHKGLISINLCFSRHFLKRGARKSIKGCTLFISEEFIDKFETFGNDFASYGTFSSLFLNIYDVTGVN